MLELKTSNPSLRRLIDAAALWVDLPGFRGLTGPELLEGLVLCESGGNPAAVRYEPHQDRAGRVDQRGDADRPDVDDGNTEDDKSYGLLQVMGYNIRRLVGVAPGTSMDFTFALLPLTNLSLGLRVLQGEIRVVLGELGQRVADDVVMARALARYNGGPTGDNPDPLRDGAMRLQRYVERVHVHALEAHRDRVSTNWSC